MPRRARNTWPRRRWFAQFAQTASRWRRTQQNPQQVTTLGILSWSGDVFTDNRRETALRRRGNQLAVRQNGMRESGAAFAIARGGQSAHGFTNHALNVRGIFREVGNDVGHRDGIVFGMPAIVIGDHGDSGVTNLGFSREL